MRNKSTRSRLVHHIQNLERLEEEKRQAGEELKAGFKAAAGEGFDRDTLRAVLKLRKLTPSQRRERRALEAIYLAALGLLDGDALPEEARRRLDGQEPPPPPSAPPSAPSGDGDDDDRTSAGQEEATSPSKRRPEPAQKPMVLKDPEEARKEGRAAAAARKRIYDNPYPAGDPCRAAWDAGWCEASDSHGMDTPAAFQRRKDKPPQPQDPDSTGKDGE